MKVLVAESENYSELAKERLKSIFPNIDILSLSQYELEYQIKDYDIVFIRLRLKITKDMMNNKLKFIVSSTTGVDHIDIEEAEKKGIKVITLKGEDDFLRSEITSSAEFTLALMLTLVKKIPLAINYSDINTSLFRGMQLKDKTLGIIGYGRNGQLMERYCKALGMNTIKYDPYNLLAIDSFEDVLTKSDIITIHTPLNPETKHTIGKKEIDMMKKGIYIVNTARGEVVNERAIFISVKSGKLAGYATDVLSEKNKELKNILINFIVTPHIAGASQEAVEKTDMFIIDKLIKFVK